MKFAKEAAGDHEGWKRVEAIYDAVRAKVEYRNGDLKGARRALAEAERDRLAGAVGRHDIDLRQPRARRDEGDPLPVRTIGR